MKTKKIVFTAIWLIIAFYYASASEAKIEVIISGQGTPMVFLPGFGCPAEVWDETISAFEENYQCHAISYPGFNGIPAPDTLWYQTVLEQLDDYMASNFDEKPIAVGHSLGGTFAMHLESRSSTFSKIILVDALPSIADVLMPNVPIESITHSSPYNQQLLAMDDVQFASLQERMTSNLSKNTEKLGLIKDWMIKADRKTYVYGYTDLLKVDLRNNLTAIQSPVLVLSAVTFNLEQSQRIIENQYSQLANKKVAYVENSGHFIMFDQLEWLISQIRSFV